jgi:sodium-dependent dicarboxylate transporter 2/3/5
MNQSGWRVFHLLAAPSIAILVALSLPRAVDGDVAQALALSAAGRWTVGCGIWMAWWWLTEPVPLPVTSLLPALIFPLLGVQSIEATLAPYADPLLFLFLGGFVLAAAIEKWGLHRRFAFSLLALSGGQSHRLVLSIMAATTFISFWLSNTATAVLMFPVALSLARQAEVEDNLRNCLVLGVAYSATIGGMGTLIGTPPNVFVSSFLHNQYHQTLDFWTWLGIGMPVVAVMMPATYWLMVRVIFPLGMQQVPLAFGERHESSWQWSRLDANARATLIIFGLAAFAWVTRELWVKVELGGIKPFAALTDAGIAMAAALALFIFPAAPARAPALAWEDTLRLPWGTLLLFGGGLSLAAAIGANQVDALLGQLLAGMPAVPKPLAIAAIATTVIFVSEVASNIATAAALTPLLAAAAPSLGLTAVEAAIITALSASSAYMMPVGTAPNALAYGSGHISTREMARTGLVLNLLSIALITLIGCYVMPAHL